jgi:uncharacterized paraquat-inducible protein A
MISIGTDHLYYLCISLLVVAAAIGSVRFWWRENTHGWNISEELLCRCRECRLIFLVKRVESMTRCPNCESLIRVRNKKSSKRLRY